MNEVMTAEVHRRLRTKMIWYLERRGCTCGEDLADEALCRALVDPGPPAGGAANLEAFAFGVLKNVWREHLRRHKTVPLEDADRPVDDFEQRMSQHRQAEELVEHLPEAGKKLLRDIYAEGKTAPELSTELGITDSGVRGKLKAVLDQIRRKPEVKRELSRNGPRPEGTSIWRRK